METAYPAAKLAANLVSAAEPRLTIELTLAALRGVGVLETPPALPPEAAADDLDGLVRLELAEARRSESRGGSLKAVRAVAQKCAAPETPPGGKPKVKSFEVDGSKRAPASLARGQQLEILVIFMFIIFIDDLLSLQKVLLFACHHIQLDVGVS